MYVYVMSLVHWLSVLLLYCIYNNFWERCLLVNLVPPDDSLVRYVLLQMKLSFESSELCSFPKVYSHLKLVICDHVPLYGGYCVISVKQYSEGLSHF